MEGKKLSVGTDPQISAEFDNGDASNNTMGTKKFNTDRIRRRMREQQGRVVFKGKMLSMAPIRILSPPPPPPRPSQLTENEKENATQAARTMKQPPLAISVTMSEADEGDNCQVGLAIPDHEDDTAKEIQAHLDEVQEALNRHSDSSTGSNEDVSVWAMLEHYICPKETKYVSSKDCFSIDDISGQSSTVRNGNNISHIQWTKGGELVQSSFYSEGENNASVPLGTLDRCPPQHGNFEGSSEGTSATSLPTHERRNIFRKKQPSKTNSFDSLKFQNTPDSLYQQWLESPEEATNENVSLLQDSMIQSVPANSEQTQEISGNDGNPEAFSVESISAPEGVDATNLSLAFYEISDSKSESGWSTEQGLEKLPPKTFVNTTEADRCTYVTRIEELEKSLQAQRNSSNELQVVLKGKVEELEQALKVTAATPRGTVVQENPIKTLLDRNQTLVKEVRFADQTCVELSAKIKEVENRNEVLESENTEMRKQSAAWEQQNNELRQQMEILRNAQLTFGSNVDATIDELSRELELTKIDLQAKTIAEENLLKLAEDGIKDLGLDLWDKVGVSLSSSLLSTSEISEIDRSNQTEKNGEGALNSMLGNTDTLQRLVIVLMEYIKQMQLKSKQPKVNINTLRQENESLGCQTDQTQNDLEEERKRCDFLEVALDKNTAARLKPLEQQSVTNLNTGLSNSDAEGQLRSLGSDMVHLDATCSAIKLEPTHFFTKKIFNHIDTVDNGTKNQILNDIQASFVRMKRRYKILEDDVGNLVEPFSDKLDCLANTVAFLRKSLIFESDSFSLKHEDAQVQDLQECWDNAGAVIDATIKENHSRDEDDDIYHLMEEARSPRSNDVEVISDLDDMSRFLVDDITLESATRPGSVISSIAVGDKWKDPLEAAIKKCQRVRERAARLKEQNDSQMATIERLEKENGWLSLNASRRVEENHLVEIALEEARKEIFTLQEALRLLQNEKEAVDIHSAEQGKEKMYANEANERLTKDLLDARKEIESLEVQLVEQERTMESLNQELLANMNLCEEYKERNRELLVQLTTTELEVTEKFDVELSDARRSILAIERELVELRRSRGEATAQLSNETSKRLELEAVVLELKNSEKQLLSDVEDRELASRLEQEDMRKERAELRAKLKETEKDAANLKEMFQSLKEKHQAQSNEKQSLVKALESQNEELFKNIRNMMTVRSEFGDLIQSIGCCKEDLFPYLFRQPQNFEGPGGDVRSAAETEIDVWKDLLPRIGEEIAALHQTVTNLSDVEIEVEDLKEQLSKLKFQEAEYLDQLENERIENEKLFLLLRQAEQEIERSTVQIKEMSKSVMTFQERENEMNAKAEAAESELAQLRQEREKIRIQGMQEKDKLKRLLSDKMAELEARDAQLHDNCSKYENLKAQLEASSYELSSKESEMDKMKTTVESLERKASVLREYVRKLTTKCEEWEESYDRQALAIEKLQQKNSRIREKASQIADKYRQLSGDIKRRKRTHMEDRANWRQERTKLNDVHGQLERELEQIAKELSPSTLEMEI